MPKIERRRTVVTLYQGNYEHDLSELSDAMFAAYRAEETGPKRQGTRTRSAAIAKKHDALRAEADETAVKVMLWAISYNEWGPLADEHTPREDNADDKARGVNMETFPNALLLASLVEPDGTTRTPEQLTTKGRAVLDDLGDISRVQYVKLERAAWDVNVGDDALPKFSAVSLLKQLKDPDSSQQPDSE